MRRNRWIKWAAAVALLLLALSFAAAAVLAEGAVHPLLRRRASDAAALANSVSRATGATASKVSIMTPDGVKLNAWWLSNPAANGRAVVVCHGVADSSFGSLGFALLFLRNGYSVLVPESRGHGESGGFVTYGVREAGDVVQWLDWMKQRGVTSAYGLGESLGGAILIQSLNRGAGFKAIVAECSYSSFESIASERVARAIPAPIAKVLAEEGILYVRLRYGVNLWDARPDVAIAHAQIPILLIHGQADHETDAGNSVTMAHANPNNTTLWLVPAATHTGAYATAPGEFEARVLAHFAHAR